jgi:dihydroorotate dehydrogenase
MPGRIVRGLSDIAEREGIASIRSLRDTALEKWEAVPLG